YLIGKDVQNSVEVTLGSVQKTVVIEWPSAAQVLHRNFNLISEVLQNFDRSLRGLRKKAIIESVGPENDGRLSLILWCTFLKPRFKGFRCKAGNFSSHWH